MIAFQGLRRKNKMPKPSRQPRQGKRDLKKTIRVYLKFLQSLRFGFTIRHFNQK